MLTAERLRELLHYDPETGAFTWLVQKSNRAAKGSRAGSLKVNGYIGVMVDGRLYLAHRLAVLWVTGAWPEHQVDHRDGMPSNNRWANLREATQSENNQNQRGPRRNSSSGVLGAFPHQGKFFSQIKLNNTQHYLGVFDTAEQANTAYLDAKRALHPFSTIG